MKKNIPTNIIINFDPLVESIIRLIYRINALIMNTQRSRARLQRLNEPGQQ